MGNVTWKHGRNAGRNAWWMEGELQGFFGGSLNSSKSWPIRKCHVVLAALHVVLGDEKPVPRSVVGVAELVKVLNQIPVAWEVSPVVTVRESTVSAPTEPHDQITVCGVPCWSSSCFQVTKPSSQRCVLIYTFAVFRMAEAAGTGLFHVHDHHDLLFE